MAVEIDIVIAVGKILRQVEQMGEYIMQIRDMPRQLNRMSEEIAELRRTQRECREFLVQFLKKG